MGTNLSFTLLMCRTFIAVTPSVSRGRRRSLRLSTIVRVLYGTRVDFPFSGRSYSFVCLTTK